MSTFLPTRVGKVNLTRYRPNTGSYVSGRWVEASDIEANIVGGTIALSLANWKLITDGSFAVTLNGTAIEITGLNFTAATSMAQVASIIDTALSSYFTNVAYSTNKFVVSKEFQSSVSTISYFTAATSGTDISAHAKLTSATAASILATGTLAEQTTSIVANVQPAKYHDLLILPESDRTKKAIRIFSYTELRTMREGSGGWEADEVLWDSDRYIVMRAKRYQMGVQDHYDCIAVRKSITP